MNVLTVMDAEVMMNGCGLSATRVLGLFSHNTVQYLPGGRIVTQDTGSGSICSTHKYVHANDYYMHEDYAYDEHTFEHIHGNKTSGTVGHEDSLDFLTLNSFERMQRLIRKLNSSAVT